MLKGLAALPFPAFQLSYSIGTQLHQCELGEWCFFLPLWGNPLFPASTTARQGLEHFRGNWTYQQDHAGLVIFRTLGNHIKTIGQLCLFGFVLGCFDTTIACDDPLLLPFFDLSSLQSALVQCPCAKRPIQHIVPLSQYISLAITALTIPFKEVWGHIPALWRDHVLLLCRNYITTRLPIPGSTSASITYLCDFLGWGTSPSRFTPISSFTVKTGTNLQLSCIYENSKKPKWDSFLRFVYDYPQEKLIDDGLRNRVASLFSYYWRLKLDNTYKEVFWDLVYKGTPCQERFAKVERDARPPPDDPGGPIKVIQHCQCETAPQTYHHVFWTCPVAKSIRQEIIKHLTYSNIPSFPSIENLSKEALFLAVPPPQVNTRIWHIVCLAALTAMDRGRASLYRLRKENERITTSSLIDGAIKTARYKFYACLLDFTEVSLLSPHFISSISPNHPFIYRENDKLLTRTLHD
jgi:hypothetical protein